MNKSASMNRPTLLTSIALAGAFAALVVALLSLAPPARGGSGSAALYPRTIKLTDAKGAHWAGGMRRAVVRSKPGLASRIVTTLPTGTTHGTQKILLVLSPLDNSPHPNWYPGRPP